MEEYFVHLNGEQIGPLTLSQLKSLNISPDTPVWYKGLANWTKASEAPETASLFSANVPPQYVSNAAQESEAKNEEPPMPCPDNYLVWAILLTICCCVPFGIVAIVKAASVNDKYRSGDYDGALRASQDAKKWCLIGLIAGVLFYIVYTAIYFMAFSQSGLLDRL